MIRLLLFVTSIFAYSAIGLMAYSYTTTATASSDAVNVTVIEKNSDISVVDFYAAEACTAQVCDDGIKI